MFRAFLLVLTSMALLMTSPTASAADDIFVYLGTYTQGDSEGIYLSTLDREKGTLSEPKLAAKADNPTFVALHPTRPLLYSVSEVREPEGSVSAFTIDRKTGMLTFLNKQSTRGGGPCHLSVDPTGRFIAAANYGGGSSCSFAIGDDGHVNEAATFVQHEGSSVNPKRQTAPHAHSANFSPDGEYVVVCDLGLDKLLVFELNTDTGEMTPNDPPSTSVAGGGGPRHFAFHPNGKFAYANLEMTCEVRAFQYHPEHGVLYGIHTLSTLPDGVSGEQHSTAETQVHPSGKFVYVSNRGHDSIAIFQVDHNTGELTASGHTSTQGEIPRNFGIDPSGQFLIAANQKSNNVVVFRIDQETGALEATGAAIDVPMPVCVRFLE